MTVLTFAVASIFFWAWLGHRLQVRFAAYTYKYEYKGDQAISKYKFIVYHNGDIIHTNPYHDTSLLGYPKMVVQALSHQRRKGMNE
jgi:hypothetical protein